MEAERFDLSVFSAFQLALAVLDFRCKVVCVLTNNLGFRRYATAIGTLVCADPVLPVLIIPRVIPAMPFSSRVRVEVGRSDTSFISVVILFELLTDL